jgi:hypothetical protein
MGSGEGDNEDVGASTLDRTLNDVLSDLDKVRLKLERLRLAAERKTSERHLKVPPRGPAK